MGKGEGELEREVVFHERHSPAPIHRLGQAEGGDRMADAGLNGGAEGGLQEGAPGEGNPLFVEGLLGLLFKRRSGRKLRIGRSDQGAARERDEEGKAFADH